MSPVRRLQIGLVAALLALGVMVTIAIPGSARAASAPTITSVAPSQGSVGGGTSVTITGTDIQAGVKVFIGGFIAESIVRVSDTQLTLITPPSSSSVGGAANVMIQNADGGAGSLSSGFFYLAIESPLVITNIEPNLGPNFGGTNVTLTGTGFSSASTVYFGDVPASFVNPLGSSAMFVRVPPNVTGPVAVTVTKPDGSKVTRSDGFTYTGSVTVDRLSPSGGPLAGGSLVTIFGNGFVFGASVMIGDKPATSVVVVNSTQIVAKTPSSALGTARVSVTNPNGQVGTRDQGFTFGPSVDAKVPVISTVLPVVGPSQGGTQVALTGTDFSGGAAVYFGTVPSPSVTLNGASSLFARAPANQAGPVSITIVNSDGGTMTLPNAYTYQSGTGITVASVSPTTGPATGGTVVTVLGAGFNSGSWVTFNGIPARSTTVLGSSQIVATTPSGMSGAVTVEVTQIGGLAAALPAGFTATGSAPTPPPVAPPVTPPVSGGSGTFATAPIFSTNGQALVIFSGGSVDQLEAFATSSSAKGVWVQDSTGAYQLLVVGGPAFLKDQFKAKFATGWSTNTPMTLTR